MNVSEKEIVNICSIDDFIKAHPYLRLTNNRFKYLLKHKAANGLTDSDCLFRIGRTIGVHRVRFREWYLAYMRKHVQG